MLLYHFSWSNLYNISYIAYMYYIHCLLKLSFIGCCKAVTYWKAFWSRINVIHWQTWYELLWFISSIILWKFMESEGLPFMQNRDHGSNFEWYPWIMPRLMQHHRSVRFRIVLDHLWIISHPTNLHHQTVVSGNIRCKIFHWSKIDMRSKWGGSDKKPWIMARDTPQTWFQPQVMMM